MLTRLAILGFVAAAVATLLDRGTLWEFTLDPERRLAMTAYWTLHALLLVLILLLRRSLEHRDRPTPIAVLGILGMAALGLVFAGLLTADAMALIRLSFVDHAPVVIVIVVGAILLRMFWRMFRDPQTMLIKRDDNTGRPTWGDALSSIAIVPVAVVALVALIALLGSSSRTALLVLDYAVFGRDPATLDWWSQLERFAWYAGRWEVFAAIGGLMILVMLLEKLFPKPAKPSDGSQ